MNELFKRDIEALLSAICHYENGHAEKVDAALVEVIADKYGFKFTEVTDDFGKQELIIDAKGI